MNQKPKTEHENAAKHVLRYLAKTKNLKLHYFKCGKPIVGYVDAEWGGNLIVRKSYTGLVFELAGCAFSWESRKQQAVTLSSTEAGYMALTAAVKEAHYLTQLLK